MELNWYLRLADARDPDTIQLLYQPKLLWPRLHSMALRLVDDEKNFPPRYATHWISFCEAHSAAEGAPWRKIHAWLPADAFRCIVDHYATSLRKIKVPFLFRYGNVSATQWLPTLQRCDSLQVFHASLAEGNKASEKLICETFLPMFHLRSLRLLNNHKPGAISTKQKEKEKKKKEQETQ